MPPSIDLLTSSSAPGWPTAILALKIPLPSPNVMVPKQSFETRRPVLPSVAYFMAFSFLVSPQPSQRKVQHGQSSQDLVSQTAVADCPGHRLRIHVVWEPEFNLACL